jgi:hypothetical protein
MQFAVDGGWRYSPVPSTARPPAPPDRIRHIKLNFQVQILLSNSNSNSFFLIVNSASKERRAVCAHGVCPALFELLDLRAVSAQVQHPRLRNSGIPAFILSRRCWHFPASVSCSSGRSSGGCSRFSLLGSGTGRCAPALGICICSSSSGGSSLSTGESLRISVTLCSSLCFNRHVGQPISSIG